MLRLEDAALLTRLSRVELARLLPELEEIRLRAGDRFEPNACTEPSIFIIRDGEVELFGAVNGREMALCRFTEGQIFGEESVVQEPVEYSVLAVVPVVLYRVPALRFNGVLQRHPELMREIVSSMARRLHMANEELLRAKGSLLAYSDELWGVLDEGTVAASVQPVSTIQPMVRAMKVTAHEQTPPLPRKGWGVLWIPVLALSLATLVGISLHRVGWSPALATSVGVLIWAVINWMLDIMPDYITALAAVTFLTAVGSVDAKVALSGFANSTWFLSLAVIGIGVALAQSGLLFRLALHMLRLVPPTFAGQSFALAVAGLLFTPVLPSPSGRVAIASPLAMELAGAMRLADRSKGSAGLGMSVLLGFGQMYFLFLNGTGSCILLWSLLPTSAREQVTWGFWLLAALPLGLTVFGLTFAAIMMLFSPGQRVMIRPETITAQLVTLGPVSPTERRTFVVVTLVLLAFMTQAWHGLDPAWTAVGGLVYIIASGIMDRDGFRRNIDWNFLVLYGGLIGLAAALEQVGLNQVLSHALIILFKPVLGYPVLFLPCVALMTTLLRVAMPMVAAAILMAIALYPLAVQVGVHPFAITLAIQVASNPWFLQHQNTFYQTTVAGTDGRAFSHHQVRGLAFFHAGVSIVSVLAAVPVWQWLGLLP